MDGKFPVYVMCSYFEAGLGIETEIAGVTRDKDEADRWRDQECSREVEYGYQVFELY